MRVPDRTLRLSGRWLGLAMSAALLGSLIPLGGVAAAGPTLTPASPTNVSADYTGTSSYATVGSITITESAAGDLTAAGTITFAAPTGFQFATTPPTVTSAGSGLTASVTSNSTSQFVVRIGTASTGTASSLSITNVRVQPTSGTIGLGVTGPIAVTGGLVSGNAGTLTEVAGATHSLTFTPQPSTSATGGTAFSQQPAVTDLDQFNNPRIGATVTLSISTAGGSGALTCTSNSVTTSSSGVATFAGCRIDKVGTYTLRAYDGMYSSNSNSIVVTVGPVSALAFTQYPGSTTTTSLGTVVVAVVDAGGNTVTSAGGTVGLGISANTSTFTCGGVANPTATLYSGVATFSNCVETVANTSYVLTATWTTYSKTGATFTITSGPAAKLGFCWGSVCNATVPTGSTGGTAFSVQPLVVLQDINGNTVTSNSTTTITLALTSNTTGATLTCAGGLSHVVASGIATFSGCSIDKVGTYQLTATSSPYYTPAASGSFVVSAGPPTKLTFTAQPTSGAAGQAFPIQPVVAITDAGGNPAATSSATITLSLSGGTPGAALNCTGGLSKTTVAGVAAFSGCSINAAGSNYYLTASATNVYPVVYLASVSGNAFNVSLPPAQITLTPSASVIVWAKPVVLTTQFGTNGANKPFVLQASLDKVHWYNIANLTTNASGAASFSYTPATNLWYQAVFAGTPDLGAATTAPFRVVVRQIALLRPTNSGTTKTVSAGTAVTFTTTVRPARPELPKSMVVFTFTLYRGGHIAYSGRREVYIDAAGLAKWTWKFGSSGLWYVRAIANPTPLNANSVWSPIEKYYVP